MLPVGIQFDDNLTGDLTGHRYRLVRQIGKGAFSYVFLALDLDNPPCEYAIKLMPVDADQGTQHAERFQAESRLLSGIHSEYVVRVTDLGSFERAPGETWNFVVMEHLPGNNLSEYLKERSRPCTVGDTLRIGRQVAFGLRDAVAAGLEAHRDLKPSNIRIIAGEKVKLMDFGLAKSAHGTARTRADEPIGSPAYMSPEQIDGVDDVDVRTDIYALGIIMFQMLMNRTPFDKPTPWEVFTQHKQAPVPPLDLPGVPVHEVQKAQIIISRCLEKQRDNRYQTPEELAEAITVALDGSPTRPIAGGVASSTVAFEHRLGMLEAELAETRQQVLELRKNPPAMAVPQRGPSRLPFILALVALLLAGLAMILAMSGPGRDDMTAMIEEAIPATPDVPGIIAQAVASVPTPDVGQLVEAVVPALPTPNMDEIMATVLPALPTIDTARLISTVIPALPTPNPAAFKDARLYSGVADFYRSLDSFDTAVIYYEQAAALAPQNPWAVNGLGQTYFELERYEEAVETLKKVEKINPQFSGLYRTYYLLGASYQKLNDCANALDYFRKAVDLAPDSTPGDKVKADAQKGIKACK